jgi:hypothetical protein
MIDGSPYIRFKDPNAKLSQPGNINLRNVFDNFNIKLKDPNGGMSGFIDKHPYLADTVRGAVSGATMLLNTQSQRQAKKAQRDYVNDPFNLYATSSMKKYGSRPWLDSTGQFTDFPNEKVPVFEPGYQNSAYTNPMATAKNGGQMYMAFQGGGATNQMGSGSSLPKYEMGAGSPIQQALLRDSQHYGLPMAKNGGFFTPEKLTSGSENEELYNKSNNFLNYLRDMSANTVVQNSLGRKRKGQLSEQEEMGMAQMGMQAPQQGAPQQGGGQEEQLIQMVAQALQQGASPEEIMQKLVEMGIPEEQAMQVVQMVAEQLQGGGEEEAQQQMPPEMQQQAPQGMGQPMPQGMEQQMAPSMQQQMPMAQMGMGGGGGDFEEFGFDSQNPLNPYYQNLYDPSEAKQVNASLMEGLYNSGKDLFSQPTAYFKGKQADAQAQLDALQKYTTPKAQYGGMMNYQDNGTVQQPSFYDEAMEQYKFFTENPDSWAGDPDMTNEDGSLNLCIDCLNVDWNNPDHIQGITRLMNEGLSKGPHMEQNHNMYMSKLKEFGLPEPKMQQKKTMKRGGITRYNMPKAQGGKPAPKDEAEFESWYNTELGKLISNGESRDKINAFVTEAKQWAYDFKNDPTSPMSWADPSKLNYSNINVTHSGIPGVDYKEADLDNVIKDWELKYEEANLRNAPQSELDQILADQDAAVKGYLGKDKVKPVLNWNSADYYGTAPTKFQGPIDDKKKTDGKTTTTTGPGGYQFNPAMQELLGTMAQGYSKAPLFGFRTNRNINALFNQTMADMMLKGQGQGQGTAGATGTTVPGAPAMGPNGAANTWFKDNNINRYDIKPGPNRFKMKIRANQNGEDIVQYDANGKLINTGNGGPGDPSKSKNFDPFRTRNFDPYPRGTTGTPDPKYTRLTSQINPGIGYDPKTFFEKARNRSAENRLERIGSKVDRAYQKERYLEDLYNETDLGSGSLDKRETKARNRRENRYNSLATDFGRGEYVPPEEMPQQRYGGSYAYGGAYSAGGQYQEGGTYYLSDEEIQALMDAGYELE